MMFALYHDTQQEGAEEQANSGANGLQNDISNSETGASDKRKSVSNSNSDPNDKQNPHKKSRVPIQKEDSSQKPAVQTRLDILLATLHKLMRQHEIDERVVRQLLYSWE